MCNYVIVRTACNRFLKLGMLCGAFIKASVHIHVLDLPDVAIWEFLYNLHWLNAWCCYMRVSIQLTLTECLMLLYESFYTTYTNWMPDVAIWEFLYNLHWLDIRLRDVAISLYECFYTTYTDWTSDWPFLKTRTDPSLNGATNTWVW